MKRNPYSKIFGKIPRENISRTSITDTIIDDFNSESPESMIYVLTGIRGSGKTVTLTEIVNAMESNPDWLCIEINSSSKDLLKSLASQLYAKRPIFDLISRAKINFSALGLGVEIKGEPPITDYASAVEIILEKVKLQSKKVLVTIDEMVTSEATKEFFKQFQIYIRKDLPIFLVATGLQKDFEKMKNAEGMTFLYRAPRIKLRSLDKIAIADSYERNLEISREKALEMAKFSGGYSFGFQALGYICAEEEASYMEPRIMQRFDHEMREKVYYKVWEETSKKEKEYLNGMACAKSAKVEDIRNYLNVDNNHFNPVRKKLIEEGIVHSPSNGYLVFALPRFGEFVKEMYIIEE
ncbi:MAG: ATP-binding protein [Lachnospiraceae bacterium]|nr:ATP-binding protein [Lachnospiraceae bacterium]